jgi:hypothetical protein
LQIPNTAIFILQKQTQSQLHPLHSHYDLSLHQQTPGCQNTKLTIITTPENAKICRTPREFKIQNKTDNHIVFTASRKAHKPSNATKPRHK